MGFLEWSAWIDTGKNYFDVNMESTIVACLTNDVTGYTKVPIMARVDVMHSSVMTRAKPGSCIHG